MPNRPLFAISADLLALADLLTEVGGDVTEAEAESAITVWFAFLGTERNTKIDHYCALIQELEARRDSRTTEARRLIALASVDGHTVQRLRVRLFAFFQAQGLTRLTTDRFQLGIVQNGGLQALEHFALPVAVPADFQKVTIDYDNVAIRQALDAGELLTFARYLPRGERLSIR
jgi:hypothetical protein